MNAVITGIFVLWRKKSPTVWKLIVRVHEGERKDGLVRENTVFGNSTECMSDYIRLPDEIIINRLLFIRGFRQRQRLFAYLF